MYAIRRGEYIVEYKKEKRRKLEYRKMERVRRIIDKHENKKNITHQTLLSDVVKMFNVLQVQIAVGVHKEDRSTMTWIRSSLITCIFLVAIILLYDFIVNPNYFLGSKMFYFYELTEFRKYLDITLITPT